MQEEKQEDNLKRLLTAKKLNTLKPGKIRAGLIGTLLYAATY
jgi:hypothetical protein